MHMRMRRIAALVGIAVVIGVAAAAVMVSAASSQPATTGPAMGAGCGGSCGGGGAQGACPMMRGSQKGAQAPAGSCPMMKMGSRPGAMGYVKVSPESAALWQKQGKLLDEHRAAQWQLFTVESQQPINQTKLTATRKSLASIDTQMGQVRTQLAEYWKPAAGATSMAPGKGMACGGACSMGGACGVK